MLVLLPRNVSKMETCSITKEATSFVPPFFALDLFMESIQSIRDSFDAVQDIDDKSVAQKQMAELLLRISSSYTAVGGRDAVMLELDGSMHTISSLLSKSDGWEQALDAIMLESEILLLKSQFHSDAGEWASAVESIECTILIAQKLGDDFAHAKALRQWGLTSLMQQQPARAEELFKRSAVLFRRYTRVFLSSTQSHVHFCIAIAYSRFFPVQAKENLKVTPSFSWPNFTRTALTSFTSVYSTISRP